jgi:hypothetical protein
MHTIIIFLLIFAQCIASYDSVEEHSSLNTFHHVAEALGSVKNRMAREMAMGTIFKSDNWIQNVSQCNDLISL